jgi:flagellar biosynthesis/type III secretory pathway protein FliH
MILSRKQPENTNSVSKNIEWKLNALLMADRQAKHYVRQPAEGNVLEQIFSPWMPKRLYEFDHKGEHSLQGLTSTDEEELNNQGPDKIEQEQTVVLTEEEIKIQKLEKQISNLEEENHQLKKQCYEEGYAQGKQDTQHSLKAQYAMLDGLISKLGNIQIDIKDYVGYIETLALELARGVCRQSASNVEHYKHLIHEAFKIFESDAQHELKLYVHPDARNMLEGRLEDLGQKVAIYPDQHLQIGDMRLVLGYTEIEEIMTQKMNYVFDRLTKKDR